MTNDAHELGGVDAQAHQRFYDRLRHRVAAVEDTKITGRDWLLLAPDTFVLLSRLLRDPQVPRRARLKLAAILTYFLLPVDFWPEAVLGVGGFVDDVLVGLIGVHELREEIGVQALARAWPGKRPLLATSVEAMEALGRWRRFGPVRWWLRRWRGRG